MWPRNREVLLWAKSVNIVFNGRPAVFKQNILPLLKQRDDLKYLRVEFKYWPKVFKVAGRQAATLLENKLDFLMDVKATIVNLEVDLPTVWKPQVLQKLADIMMGVKGAKKRDVTGSIPIVRDANAAIHVRSRPQIKKEPKHPNYTYRKDGKGRVNGRSLGSRYGRF